MKYTYKFVNGDILEIDVSEEMYRALTNEDRLEYNNNQTNMTRAGRFVSLDMAQEEEGMQFADPTSLPPTEADTRVQLAIARLTENQRALIQAIFFDGMQVSEYAKKVGVSQSAISHRICTIQKNLKKILNDPHI